jgi:hypothetical protein
MDAYEPRVRRRGFFLHSDTTGEAETGEHDTPEGLGVRVRTRSTHGTQPSAARRFSGARPSGGRAMSDAQANDGLPQIRSGSVTGSRQRAHWPR